MTTTSPDVASAADPEPTPPPVAPRRRWPVWGDVVAVGLVATAIAAAVLQVWRGPLDVPWRIGGDADFYLMLADATVKHGWHLTNPELAAPYGQDLFDLPHGADNLQLLLIKIIGFFTGGDAVAAVNLYFLVTFPLIAIAMYGCLRVLRVQRLTSAVMGVLFALLPYHFIRGSGHLFLSGYYMVPIGVLLILLAVSADPPLSRDGSWWPRLDKRGWFVLLGCAGIASTGAYYAIFTLVLLVATAVAVYIGRRDRRILVSAATIAVAIGLVFLLNLAPTLAYWALNGVNADVAQRTPQETELYGLRISELITPRQNHRIAPLREADEQIDGFINRSENGMPLGLVGAIGFLGLIGGAVVVTLTRTRRRPATKEADDDRLFSTLHHLSGITLIGVLVAAMGGFSLILSTAGLREIRAWNRISIVLGALALMAFALVWDRYVARRFRGALAVALILAVGLVGVLDQTGPNDEPPYAFNEATWNNNRAFVADIEAEVPANSMIFQVPYVSFPESNNIESIGSYDGARLSLVTDDLRWSYGAMEGRQTDWQATTAALPPEEQVADLRTRGFAGIVVDRFGYGDREDADAYIDELTAITGNPAIRSGDDRYAFVSLA